MAKLIQPDGTTTEVSPSNGKRFTLAELQTLVGGYVEPIRLRGVLLLVDEDGLQKELPCNQRASGLAGQRLVGTVLLTTKKESGC